MEDKQQNEISYEEWAEILLENPERYKEAIDSVDNYYKLFDIISSMMIDTTFYKNRTADNMEHNKKINNLQKNLNDYFFSSDRVAPEKETIADELKQEIRDDVNSYINIGYPPDKLAEVCKQYGYRLDQIYTQSELIEKYSDYGITCDLEKGTLDSKWFETRHFSPLSQQSEKNDSKTKLSAKESELSDLETEAKYLDEAEATLNKETQKDEI